MMTQYDEILMLREQCEVMRRALRAMADVKRYAPLEFAARCQHLAKDALAKAKL
jgi:hypothetical protein